MHYAASPLADRYQPRYRTGADEPRTGANKEETMRNLYFEMLLDWARTDKTDFARGMTMGWMLRDQLDDHPTLQPWQRQYVENIANARRDGVSA